MTRDRYTVLVPCRFRLTGASSPEDAVEQVRNWLADCEPPPGANWLESEIDAVRGWEPLDEN